MKNILFVHYGDNWLRGSERCLLDLLANLDRSLYQPLVWCNSPVMAEAVAKMNIPVRVDAFPLLLGWAAPRFDVPSYLGLIGKGIKHVLANKIDLIHVNSGGPCQWMVPVAKTLRKPLVAHLHARYGIRERCSLALHQVSHIVGASKRVIEALHNDGVDAERLQVIYNGVATTTQSSGLMNYARELIHADEKEVVLAAVGSLIPRKGFDILLNAMQLLVRKKAPVRLLVIGDGPERFNLQNMAMNLGVARKVHFLGERNDVSALLHGGIDILVSGAREEVFGLTLAEAGVAHVPVIAPRIGGISEVVVDGETGSLVEPENPQAFADAIERLVQNPLLRKRMGYAGHCHVQVNFHHMRYSSEFHACYAKLLEDKNARLSWFEPLHCLSVYFKWTVGTLQRYCLRQLGRPAGTWQ